MGYLFEDFRTEGGCKSETAAREWMGVEVLFSDIKFAKAFDSLTDESKARIAAYVQCDFSPTKAAQQLGLSRKNFGKRLQELRLLLGAKSLSELLVRHEGDDGHDVAYASELMGLLESQNYRCALSGVKLKPNTAELDHKVPSSKGGTHTIENLQWVHRHVNRAKGSITQSDFIAMCNRVSAWTR